MSHHQISDAIFMVVALASALLSAIQTLRLAALRRRAFLRGVNVIRGLVLPAHDDPRWTLKIHDISVERLRTDKNGKNWFDTIHTHLHSFKIGDVTVSKQDAFGDEFIDDYCLTIGDTKFETFMIGFAIKRYWKAIQHEHTQRTATKSVEAP